MNMATPSSQADLSEGYSALCDAVKSGNKNVARLLILNNVSVNPPKKRTLAPPRRPASNAPVNPTKKFSFSTPLHWAVTQFDDTEILDMLLAKGADFSHKDFRQKTPLHIAIELNKRNMVESLLNNGAHVSEDLSTLIVNAIEAGNKKTLELLVKHGVKAKGPINLESAVNIAAEKGNKHILRFLLSFENALGNKKWIPTNLILKNGSKYENCLQLLIQNRYSLDLKDGKNFSSAYKAVKKGCTTVVDRFLKLGIDVNKVNKQTGLTFLHLACIKENAEMIKLLINYRPNMKSKVLQVDTTYSNNPIDLKIKDAVGKTALFIAVNNLNVTIIKLLLTNGASVHNDSDLLNIAIKKNSKEVVTILLKLGVNVNAADITGVTPLHYIISGNSPSYEIHGNYLYSVNHLLLPSNDSVNDNDKEYIKSSMVELLLSHGANIDAQIYKTKRTALHLAVQKGFEIIVNVLLRYNATVTLADSTGCTPLHTAIGYNNINIVDIFLKHGVDINIKNSKGNTLLHDACVKGNKIVIEKLLRNNANIHCVNDDQETPLHLVCRSWNYETIQNLLSYCPNVNARDKYNQTPFHVLCKQDLSILFVQPNFFTQLEDICKSLIKLNANINAVDSARKTPLFNACSSGNFEIVRILLKYQVNVNTLDSLGRTPLHVAALKKNKGLEIVKLLLEKNANTTHIDKNGRTILHNAVTADNLDLVEMIYQFNVDINARNEEGNTALHIATRNGSELVANSLLKNGADIMLANNDQKTVLHFALDRIEAARTEAGIHRIDQRNNDDMYDDDDWNDNDSFDSEDDSDYEHYQSIVYSHEGILKTFKNQAIKLKSAGLCNDSEIINFVDFNPEDDEEFGENVENDLSLEKECEKEIEKLRNEKIGHLTLYDILTKNIYKVAKFTNNERLIEALRSKYYEQIFPIYIDIIRSRFKEGLARKKLLKTIETRDLTGIFTGLPIQCIDEIFKYLNREDLKTFVSVLKK